MTSSTDRSTRPRERIRTRGGEGLHRQGRPAGTTVRPAAWDDASLDGLFTYCLSVMCEHPSAIAALGEALAVAERRHERGRRPPEPALWRPWLYALARWACMRRLTEQHGPGAGPGQAPGVPRAAGPDAVRRRRELAALAWPEAAGTTPREREALELAVRHRLPPREVAEVLRLPEAAARSVLARGAREVERTRAALAVVAAGGCRSVSALAGGEAVLLLAPGMRRELVRHVEECAVCGRAVRRPEPGTGPLPAARLTVLPAPREAVDAARLAVLRARAQHLPRFDRTGFPVEERARAERRRRLRSRAVTTTVVAAVLAAPALALWAAYRGAPPVGEPGGAVAPVAEEDGPAADGSLYENAGRAGRQPDGPSGPAGEGSGPGVPPGLADGPAEEDEERPGEPPEATPDGPSGDAQRPAGPGRLTVEAVSTEDGTRITLTASGGAPVHWTAATETGWLRLSRTSGTLRPGETATVLVTVDRDREPPGSWQGRIYVDPSGSVITVEGRGAEPAEPAEPEPSVPPESPDPEDPPPDGP
ncbi:BACON domain-containing protein [Streptomyces sodiiphilus]